MPTAIDPTTGATLWHVKAPTPAETAALIGQAEQACDGWRRQGFAGRAAVLRGVARRLRDQVETLAPLMTEEMGKPIREARAEVLKSAWCAEHYAEHAAAYLADEEIASDAGRSYVRTPPLGVVLGILPWNAPFWIAFRFLAPALMAGNTCVVKPDPHVPRCGQAIAALFADTPGLVVNLPLETPQVEAAIRDPRVEAVSFTGSDRAGAVVAAVAASEIKKTVLELGGSDPCIVLADADLEQAAGTIALSRTINAGQSCIAAKRIIAEAPVHDRLVSLLRDRLARLTVGDPRREDTDIGPIARADLRDTLHRQVQDTIHAGARCRLGGVMPDGDGFFYPVTLLTEVRPGMAAAREETFGPVAVVMRAEDAAAALRLANDTPYGLAASIWSARGEALAHEIEAGQVAVNGIVKTDPRLPSGGIKRSGYGRELGPHGIREFVNVQQIWVGTMRGR